MIAARYEAPCRVRVEGHAGYAPAGRDIVCAAVSALWGTLERELREREKAGQGRLTVAGGLLSFAPEVRHRREIEGLYGLIWRGLTAVAEGYGQYLQTEKTW